MLLLPYTTPFHSFKLPVSAEFISKLYITYAQDDLILFEKTLEDCEFLENNTKVRVLLSQEETGKINDCGHDVLVQVTGKTLDNKRFTSKARKLKTGKVIKKEVI